MLNKYTKRYQKKMLIAKIYMKTPKDTKYQNSEMIYKSRKTLNYQRYDIPKDIKISKKKKKNKRYNIPKIYKNTKICER